MNVFDTSFLDQHIAQRQQQEEAERQSLLKTALSWLSVHSQNFGVQEGFLFGSITQARRFHHASDVDIAVESLSPGNPFSLISTLSTVLDREVDLVALDQCHFAEKIRHTGIAWTQSNS
ncbi:MAG: nucleotidyltransferase domain-containing protein [Acaryochloris sp. RU_4_1]|nr:nucleotidyltransferase domain-containing protein [Acaryochloris sp. SU_5_25]NJM64280.1 nucleotidyltransferase domain-containing protein [Acaryochloris sp. RU_4_1]